MTGGIGPTGRALLGTLAREAGAAGAAAYLVGGALRDHLLGREPADLDIALETTVPAAAILVGRLVKAGWSCEARHAGFGTATLRAPDGLRVDLAVAREETYPSPGVLPVVRAGAPIALDLVRRDFTVNAMACRIGPGGLGADVLDPVGGTSDLALGRIRLLHGRSLADDPTRVVRAARYAARLDFTLDDGFGAAIEEAVASGAFGRISGDRLRRALSELLTEENRAMAVELLLQLGVPGLLVEGWLPNPVDVRALDAATGIEDAWRCFLASSSPELRARVATRLTFSRALRRATGCPR